MFNFSSRALLALSLFGTFAVDAFATRYQFEFTYTTTMLDIFNPAGSAVVTVGGTFEGLWDGGNFITEISDPTLALDGVALGGPHYVGSYQGSNPWSAGGATISFNGIGSNFLFIDGNYLSGGFDYHTSFEILAPSDGSYNFAAAYFFLNPGTSNVRYLLLSGEPVNSSWSVRQVGGPGSEPTVPDSSPIVVFTAFVFALGVVRSRLR
jgi:hypothetical protein